MEQVKILQYPNLYFSGEVIKKIKFEESLTERVKQKMLETFYLLDKYGTDNDYLNKRIEMTYRNDIWEMKFKDKSKTEWRILFKKISRNKKPAQYALLTMFKKSTQKLSIRDLDTAERIASREGW